ncbi:MAG: hypothetical protein MZU84_08185 [Sphingobacterium sp.]|nr:hypothetical protein [Sphingobacterium sp.]
MAHVGIGYWVNAVLVYLALPIIPLALVSLAVVVMMRFINVSRKKDALILVGSLVLIGASLSLQIALGRSGGGCGRGLGRTERRRPPRAWPRSSRRRTACSTRSAPFSRRRSGRPRRSREVSAARAWRTWRCSWACRRRAFRRDDRVRREALLPGRDRARRDDGPEEAPVPRRDVAPRGGRAQGVRGDLRPRVEDHEPDADLPPQRRPRQRAAAGDVRPDGDDRHGRRRERERRGKRAGRRYHGAPEDADGLRPAPRHPGRGPVHDDLRQHQRDGVVDVLAGGRAVLDLAGHPGRAAGAGGGQVRALVSRGDARRRRRPRSWRGSFLHVKASQLAAGAGLALVAGVALTAVGMIIDLARPLLDWTNPQKAIKQNLNVLLALMADAGILTAAFFGVKALVRAKLAPNVVLGIVFVGLAALSAVSYSHPAQVRRQALPGNFLTGSDLSKLFY